MGLEPTTFSMVTTQPCGQFAARSHLERNALIAADLFPRRPCSAESCQ
jgi:hypothetical protein